MTRHDDHTEVRVKAQKLRRVLIDCLQNRRPFPVELAKTATIWHNRDLTESIDDACKLSGISKPTFYTTKKMTSEQLKSLFDSVGEPRRMKWI